MAKTGSVIGKKQIHYGQVVQLNSEDEENEEETEKKKCEFSKDVDQFIWLVYLRYICSLHSYTNFGSKLFINGKF